MQGKFWPIPWTSEQISRFWAWQSENMLDNYFTLKMGAGIVQTLEEHQKLRGALVIDYGAGPGFLTGHLLAAGARVWAVDQSRESLQALESKYPTIIGTSLSGETGSLQANMADAVVLIETIEHLLPDVRIKVLRDIRRLLKIGGVLFVTCPNAEDLAKSRICCPNCGGVFHTVQHVASFDSTTLQSVLTTSGFGNVQARPTYFASSAWIRRRKHFSARWFGRKLPHLYAVARRLD